MEPMPPTRRSFLDWAIHGLGTLFAVVLGAPVVAYLIDPRNRAPRPSEFRSVARFSELPVGAPVQAVIRDVKQDAWTLYPNELIGRVWLIRRDDQNVDVFTTICPHLGCSVNYDGTRRFVCPCHNGTFHLSGERMTRAELGAENPAPRGMDALEVRRDPDNPDLVQVKYVNFIQGLHEKQPKT